VIIGFVDFRILGPLEVLDGERVLKLGGLGRRATLALLLLEPNRVVPVERLVDGVWGDAPPSSAQASLQNHVWRLRRVLGDRLQTRSPGYLLRVEPEELDLERFRRLVREAQGADPEVAAETLRRALVLWRGPVLADLADEPIGASAGHLDELRVAALEERVDADLALGRHTDLVAELEALVEENPFRERLRGQLILALYRSGRQGDALGAYAATRRAFVDELGTEPGDALQELHRAVLQQAPELAAPRAATPQAEPAPGVARESRKWVTVLVAGLAGENDSVDPEVRRELLRTRWDECAAIVERLGGSAERMGSDRLLGVFGAPAAHDDDGLRAVGAAFELRERGLSAALATGEVIAGGSGDALISGAVVDEATRLHGRAGAGEILAADRTWKLVMHATTATAVDGARRLDTFDTAAPALPRRLDTAFVGRANELAELDRVFASVAGERRVRLVTVYGAPGIGKSRLVAELARRKQDAATCLFARCVPDQEDATFAPLRDIVTALAGAEPAAGLRELVAGEREGELIAARVAAAVGAGSDPGPVEETAWAVRRLLETLARSRPLVLVLEDVHWAAPALLDLVEQVGELARGPILVLCLARHELLEARPGRGGGHVNSSSLLLEALSDRDSETILVGLEATAVEYAARERILATAEGNPLFLEQFLAAAQDGVVEGIPDSIHGLLDSRLDRLEPTERAVAEAAAVCGIEFSAESVAELTGADVLPALSTLARRQLVQLAEEQSFAEETWTFRHGLIREAAYEAVPKRRRASLHEAFARRVIRIADAEETQWDELAGYHLEQSVRWRDELGEESAALEGLRLEAGERLAAAGSRAYNRNDLAACTSLLERAVPLLPPDSAERVTVAIRLGTALGWSGRGALAWRMFEEARAGAERLDDRRLMARVVVAMHHEGLWTGRSPAPRRLLEEVNAAIRTFEATGDDEGLAQAYMLQFHAKDRAAITGYSALDHALAAGRRARSSVVEATALGWMCTVLPRGPMATSEALERALEILELAPNRLAQAAALGALGLLHAMRVEYDEGRRLVEEDDAILLELGLQLASAAHSIARAEVEMMAGQLAAAERILRAGYDRIEALGDDYSRVNAAWRLALVLSDRGKDDEALRWARIAEAAPPAGFWVPIWWRLVQAVVLARRAETLPAARLLDEAVESARAIPESGMHADVWITASEAARILRSDAEGDELLREAVAVAERKEYWSALDRARALLGES
jgi:DNA-binding SARP family transcriptional activator